MKLQNIILKVLVGLLSGFVLFQNQGFSQKVEAVAGVAITVSEMDKILPFYQEVLGFQLLSMERSSARHLMHLYGLENENAEIRVAKLKLGNEAIELIDFLPPLEGDPIPADSKSNDLWFQHIAIVTNDMVAAYAHLRKHNVKHVSTAPQTLPEYIPAAAGIKAFYFRDPDGHNLEVIYFPPGKGNPKWQQLTGGGPFIGIDHTAIGISDTQQSLAFYRDLLGFKIGGMSENFGPEQEHLNQVFGARLMITGLAAASGIGVEFLEYIAPPGGRKYPQASESTDLWHWHTVLKVSGLDVLLNEMRKRNYEMVSTEMVPLETGTNTSSKACIVRDPDGHALLLLESITP